MKVHHLNLCTMCPYGAFGTGEMVCHALVAETKDGLVLVDTCMGLAVLSMLDQGFAQTTLEFKISFVRPITPQTGLVTAEGKVIACGRRVGTAEGKLTDKDGRLLAHGTTTCLIFEH